MRLPEPVIRPDAVDHYVALLPWVSVGLCVTVVRQVPVDEALVRFDSFPSTRRASFFATMGLSADAYPDSQMSIVVADVCAEWTLLAENNGLHGSRPDVLTRLSQDTVAASAYWSVNRVSSVSYAQDGRVLATFHSGEQPQGEDPDQVTPFLHGLAFDEAPRDSAEALTFLERVSGVRVTVEWLSQPHTASVIVPPRIFEPIGMDGWVDHVAPDVAAAMSHASAPELRAWATLAATHACQAARVDDQDVLRSLTLDTSALSQHERSQLREYLLAQARAAYQQALYARWDHNLPPDETLDDIAKLQAEMLRQRTTPVHERRHLARAHAIGAAYARMADNPQQALTWALINAFNIDRGPRPTAPPDSRPGPPRP